MCACGLILTACTAPTAGPGAVPATTTGSSIASPLSSPLPTIGPTPTYQAGTGSVTGRLTEGGAVGTGRILYLATLIKDASGKETSVRLDRGIASRAIVDAQGKFTFFNIKPTRYAIIVDTVRDAYMLRKPNNAGDLIFEVTSDKETDLGTLDYDVLPR